MSEDRAVSADLARMAAGGDREAFDSLVRLSAERIFNLALRLTGNTASAEDLSQDAFVNAWRNIGNFRGAASFESWVYAITVNTWKNRVKYEKIRRFFSTLSLDAPRQTQDGECELQIAGPDPDPLEAAEGRSACLSVQSALRAVPDQLRLMLVMRDCDGKSYEEIAALIGMPLGTVKSRISRAREAFRQAYIRETKGTNP